MAQSKRRNNVREKAMVNLPPDSVKSPARRKNGFVVSGVVRDADGNPRAGALVKAYDQDLRKEQLLGKRKTDAHGNYRISYSVRKFLAAEKGRADLRVCVVDLNGKELVASDILFNAPAEAMIDFTLPAEQERRSEFELLVDAIRPLLKGQGKDGQDLNVTDLEEKDLPFLARETGRTREQIAMLVAAAKAVPAAPLSARLNVKTNVSKSQSPAIPVEVLYAWFRMGLPTEPDALWSRPGNELATTLKRATTQNIVSDALGKQVEEIDALVKSAKVERLLKPAASKQPASLGDLLRTMPRPFAPEKERIVAAAISDAVVTTDDLANRLKEAKFDDKEIAGVLVTRALGDLTKGHAPLVQELQTLRIDDADASLRYLASQTPLQWLELVDQHGVPSSLPISSEQYAEQLEHAVEAQYPTAVFAARVKDGLLELKDPAYKTAANFLAANPELELTQQNIRAFINKGADLDGVAEREQLVDTLQQVQRVQKLSANYQEAGILLDSNFQSSLDIVQQGPDRFLKAIGERMPPARAREIFDSAQQIHDTTIALIGNVIRTIEPRTLGPLAPSGDETEQPALGDYPNLRKLFGNLDTCECNPCQSVLGPAAYLVDVMRFLDPKDGFRPLSVLLARRPDIADLELTCANTSTEIPYIDLVLEVLENAIGLPIDISGPVGFDPEEDFKQPPFPSNAVKALRAVLKQSAISVGDHLEVSRSDKQLLIGNHIDWLVTDGPRHWVLRHWPQAITVKFTSEQYKILGIPVHVTNFSKAIAALDHGELPETDWLIPAKGSARDSNLPLKGAPVIKPIKAGSKWQVQYSRFVRAEIRMGSPMGAVILKTAQGQQLDAVQTTTGVLKKLAVSLVQGQLAEPLVTMLPSQFQYAISPVGSEWDIETTCEATLAYVPQQLQISSLTYQSSGSREDLKASPENRNPEAYRKLDTAVYPWTLPFNLDLEQVRAFLERRGIPRRQLMEQSYPASRLLTDASADAISREVLGLAKSEAEIIAPTTPQSYWDYWGLEQNDNSVTDLNDETTVVGSWIQVLSHVSILLQRSGLNYGELLNVLQTQFVRKEPPILSPKGDDCNPSTMRLAGLKPVHLDRIHRLVRLWRKLGWSLFDLDLAISAVTSGSMELTPATLRRLSHIQRLHELLGLPIGTIASWWGTLFTASHTDYTTDKRTASKSVYEQLFLNSTVQNPPDADFALDQLSSTTKTLLDKAPVFTAVLGIRSSDLAPLINACVAGGSSAISLPNLAALYRHTSLAKALGLTVEDYLRALNLIERDPFQSTEKLIQFVEAVQFVLENQFAFSFEEIDYLLRYTTDAGPTALFSPAWTEQTLTDVRTSLQTVQKEVLDSAEPPAEHMQKMLAKLGWYPELIEEAVNLLGTNIQFQAQIQASTPPATVTIPLSLRDWVSYQAAESKLLVSGTLSPSEWADLSAANSANGAAVTAAIEKLRTDCAAFVTTLSAPQHRLQSFDLPSFRVTYDPSTPPTIPADMSARLYYDQPAKEIVFTGWMTDQLQQKKLRDVLPTPILQSLRTSSDQYQEQSSHNLFLSADDLKTLFAHGQTPESRFRRVLEKLIPWFHRETAVERLSPAVNLEQAVARGLLLGQLANAQALDALIAPPFVSSDARVRITATSFPDQMHALGKLNKAALICTKLKLKPCELPWLPKEKVVSPQSSPYAYDLLAFDSLPIKPSDTSASFVDWQSLVQLFELRGRPQVGPDLVAGVLKQANANDKAKLQADIAQALQISGQEVADTAEDQLHLTWPGDYLDPARLLYLMQSLLAIQKLGVHAAEVFSLAQAVPGADEAVLARNILRARSDASNWSEQLKPIEDILREKQRNALVAYLVARDHLRDAKDLYDRYLVDVEMGSCKVSTRILHAISAVQLFVQRCLMNLERDPKNPELDVSPSEINAERWQWMKNYRVWEANRKVFLYPENWIEPELRDDKSEIFKELEGQLLQNELDNGRAEEILKDYLRQLEDISRLVIVGMYVENLSGYYNTGITAHIVGRTHNRPSHFFYRRWVLSFTLNYWTPWERLPLDGVKTDHILPFVMRGDMYVAWPEITQLPAETDSGDNETAGPKWQLRMAWIRKTGRGWSERYLTQDKIETPWVYGKDENQTFSFRVRYSASDPTEIDCYAAQRDSAVKYDFSDSVVPPYRTNIYSGTYNDALQRMDVTMRFSGKVVAAYTKDNSTVYQPVYGAWLTARLVLSQQAEADFDWEWAFASGARTGGPRVENAHTRDDVMQVSGYTNSDGTFDFSLNLIAKALLRDKVLESSPKFKLELKTFPDGGVVANPTEVFDYRDTGDTNQYLQVSFNKNFVVKRQGTPTGIPSDRPLSMELIRRFRLLAAEDAEIVQITGAPLSVPDGTLAYASGYLEKLKEPTDSDAFSMPNISGITLWNNTPGRFFVLPAFPIESYISNVLYYKDQNDSYLIRRDNSNDAQGKYLVVADGHPRAGELRRNVARDGLDSLFALANQSWSDPAPTSFNQHGPNAGLISQHSMAEKAIRFDPAAPYASYNIELFFHVPFLIANYLSNNQRFPEAQQWFHRIFNPTTDDQATGNKRFWRYWPFRENSDATPIDELLELLAYEQASGDNNPQVQAQVQEIKTQIQEWLENPFRPHTVARLRPRAYEFAVFFKYIDNLIAWADQLFRQSTTESINEATQLYILVAKLLGERPSSIPRGNQAPALTYRSTAGKWDKFSNAWFELEANLVKPKPHGSGGSRDTGTHSLTSIGMLYFCVPGNEKLLSYWDKIENRLFNIRHCRNIEGVEQPVPPFQPAIDPGLLVRAVAAGLDISTVLSDMNAPLPYYRFNVLAQKASELCADLKALGSALLSTLEKKDAEELALLRSSQEIDLLNLVKEVKLEQIEEAKANLEALKQSELLAMVRFVQYQKLLGKTTPAMPDDPAADVEQTSTAKVSAKGDSGELSGLGLLQAEQQQFEWSDVAVNYSRMAGAASTLAGIMHAIPQTKAGAVVGEIEFGGLHLGSIFDSISAFLRTFEANANHFASRVSTIGQYQRRQDEWVFQSRLALKEIGQIRKQIAAAEIRKLIAEKELANHEKQIKNAEDVAKFMHDKYTNRELYQWMVNQISSVYFQTHQLAYDLAKRAERAFRHELGLQDSSFIQFGYWDNLKKGLLAGERLQLDLKRMEVAYLDQNKREYEITKHVSLLSLNPIALLQLRKTGRCEFDIEEEAFDLDFPGHFMRRIKSVSLSLPCVTGPYIGVNCTLTLLKSSLRHSSALRDSKYQRDLSTDDPRFTDYYGSIQSVATSSGQNDSGLFEANLRDERYLPFEGAGVISTWRIELPDQFRQFDYDSIADIILHVRYTSREGGALLQTGALANLDTLIKAAQTQGIARLFSVRHEFPAEWAKFKSAKINGAVKTAELTLTLREEHYPYWTRGFTMTKQLEALADTKREDIQISDKPNPADSDAKKDTLVGVFGGLRMCRLTEIQPPPPIGKFTLYLTDNSMEDLWLVFTRGKGN